ncbi:MAG: DsbA family protein [Gemmatimonadaceae bacterium]
MAQARKTPNAARQRFILILVVIAVAGAAGLGWLATRPKGSAAVAIDPNLPPAKAEGYLLGREDAPVKIIEFADFECPACGQFATLTEPDVRARLVATGLASVRFYDFPLPMHKNTWSASNAAACADDQGKFWEMHDRLFYAQDLWNGEATSSPEKKMKGFADDLGLDRKKFDECFDSQVHYPRIKASGEEAERRGVTETPSFIIGSTKYAGSMPYDEIKKLVDAELAKMPKADTGKKAAK